MANLTFIQTIYVRTTREKLWEALTIPEITKQFWGGYYQRSDWKLGSPWSIEKDGEIWDTGEVLEIDPPARYVVTWRHERFEDFKNVGETRLSMILEQVNDAVKFTVIHEIPEGGEGFLEGISRGWPKIMSSVKSLLETGKPLEGEL